MEHAATIHGWRWTRNTGRIATERKRRRKPIRKRERKKKREKKEEQQLTGRLFSFAAAYRI
jgi:hypothetical protein